MLWAAATMDFFGLLRMGEVVVLSVMQQCTCPMDQPDVLRLLQEVPEGM